MKRIDFRIQLLNLLPDAVRRRSEWIKQLAELIAIPLQETHDKYQDLTQEYDEYLNFENFRKRVEEYLQMKLDNPNITVVNQQLNIPARFYQKVEKIGTEIRQKSEIIGFRITQKSEETQPFNFVVYSNGSDVNKIKAIVEQFKIAGTNYKII